MPRAKGGPKTRHRRKKVLKLAKGHQGARSKLFKRAHESVEKGLAYAYTGRKIKKRDYRALWITRISAAAELLGINYSSLMGALTKANIEIDRKNLANMAVADMDSFKLVVKEAGIA